MKNKFFLKNLAMLLLLCSSISFSQNSETITWSENIKLEWKDFTGTLNPDLFGYALTSYKIEIIPKNVLVDDQDRIQNYIELTVVANFYKNHSWTISDDIDLLQHEQLHFDIAELFARKIRKRFEELKSKEENRFNIYFSEYKKLWNLCRAYQKQYDDETKHGAKKDKNKEWIIFVHNELKALDSFKVIE